MVLGVAALVAILHSAVADLGEMNRLVAGDTAPGVVALHGMSVNLARLRGLLNERLGPPAGRPTIEARIDDERQALSANNRRWLTLPVDPGEAELMEEVHGRLDRLDDLVRRIQATTPDTAPVERAALRSEVDTRVRELDEVLLRAAELNGVLASSGAAVAERVGKRLLPAAIGVEVGSLILAALALGAAYRASRTEAALAERWLLQQRNAELEAFTGRVAHDVLSPLMTVGLALGLAQQRLSGPGDARLQSSLGRAVSSLQRVRQVVSDLLDFARAAAVPLPGVETEVAPLVEGLLHDLEPLAMEAGVDLRVTAAPPVRVRCAPGVLTSILTNLVQNAIRHAGEELHVEVRTLAADAEVRFEVEDTGPGVPPEDRARIFEPYVRATAKGPGLGLGLSTVKRLAESHGGHAGVCTRAGGGHGSLFWVTLPTAAPPPDAAHPP
jgi:signal transduction histidine kinase